MKLILILLFCSLKAFSQDIYPTSSLSELRSINDFANYKGKTYQVNKYLILRTRVYGKKAVQVSEVFRYRKVQIRIYQYLNIPQFTITKAISIRVTI